MFIFHLQQQFLALSVLSKNLFFLFERLTVKIEDFLKKYLYTKTCVQSHVNRSPRRNTVYLQFQNLHTFSESERRNLLPWPRVAFGTWNYCKHAHTMSWFEENSNLKLVKVFRHPVKRDATWGSWNVLSSMSIA